MKDRHSITIFATALSIVFAVMMRLAIKYSDLLLNLEVITLPVIYILGYEMMIEKQKFIYQKHLLGLERKIRYLNNKIKSMKLK